MGAGDQGAGAGAADADVARRARLRRIQERSDAHADRNGACSSSWVDGGLPRVHRVSLQRPLLPLPPSLAAVALAKAAGGRSDCRPLTVPPARPRRSGRIGARGSPGWSFEPGDPLITSRHVLLRRRDIIGNWVAGDAGGQLPAEQRRSGLSSPVRVRPAAPRGRGLRAAVHGERSVLRLATRGGTLRRAASGSSRCAAERRERARTAELLAVRPMLDEGGGAEDLAGARGRAQNDRRLVQGLRSALPAHLLARAAGGSSGRCATAGRRAVPAAAHRVIDPGTVAPLAPRQGTSMTNDAVETRPARWNWIHTL